MSAFDTPSELAIRVLSLLRDYHNVLLTGPPATGKSRLLAEVKYWFAQENTAIGFAPGQPIAFPQGGLNQSPEWLPSSEKTARQIFEITFHQGTKYRDFIGGLAPQTIKDEATFKVVHGPLYLAAQHAQSDDGAALLIVDEINRGPAIAAFGDTITAIERDKRLRPDNTKGEFTASFRAIDDKGDFQEISLSSHLYLLGAMNEADTSVEPLDVAFRRRWQLFRLAPDEARLRAFLGLAAPAPADGEGALPNAPTETAHILEAAVQAWSKVNARIELGRGAEFQLGHGIFMDSMPPATLPAAQAFAVEVWSRLFSHAAEIFFGDTRGLGFVVGQGAGRPYEVQEKNFADNPVPVLKKPSIATDSIYAILRAAAKE
ncbi:MAG TPA: AAA family ATPase [Abditibacterium sp.]|jgi:5-methylcytosine-specific restriction protein B